MENVISNLEFGGWKICGGKCYLEISKLGGGGKFGVENAISNLEFGGWKIWGGKCCPESRIWGVENLGWKMLSRISNLGCGKFGVEKCYLESRIWGVENLGWKMLLETPIWVGGGKFGVESAISNLEFGGGWKICGGKCYLEISNLGGWKIWGGKCYLESRIWGVEYLGWKMLSRNSNLGGVENLGGKCYIESRIWGVENLG